jgi:hypothetical protein
MRGWRAARLALAPAWPANGRPPYPAVNAGFVGPFSASGTCEHGSHGECDQKAVQQHQSQCDKQGSVQPPLYRPAGEQIGAPRRVRVNKTAATFGPS